MKGGGRLEELFVISAAEHARFGWPEPGWDSEAGSCLCTSHPSWTRCWVQAEQKCNGRKGPEPTQQLPHLPRCFLLVPKLNLPQPQPSLATSKPDGVVHPICFTSALCGCFLP